MLDGLKLSLEQIAYQAGGRKIELFEEDTEGNSTTAIAKYRKLVSHDKIHVLTGVLLANVGNSLVPLIERDQLPTLFLTTPDDLTKRKIAKWLLRSNFAASQIMHPLGDYAAKTLKYRRVATIAMDNPFGHEEIGGFQRVFEDSGAKVVQKLNLLCGGVMSLVVNHPEGAFPILTEMVPSALIAPVRIDTVHVESGILLC